MSAKVHPADRLRLPLALLGLAVPLVLWQAVAWSGALPEAVMPAPGDVLVRAAAIAAEPRFQLAAGSTLYRWLVGFMLGGFAGLAVGLLVGSTIWTRNSLLPTIDFFRSIPVTIAFPAFLLAFGLSDTANIAMSFAATVFLVALNVAIGVGAASPQRTAFLALMQAGWFDRMRYLYFPEAFASFVLALRATLSLSLIVTLLSEMFIGSRHGVGQAAYDAYLANSPATVFAIILWVGLAGLIANRAFSFLTSGSRLP